MPAEDLGRVIYETEGPVARIALNWPEKANAQSSEMVWQVDVCLDRAEDDDAYFQMPLVQGLGFPGGETMIEPWTFMNRKRAAEYLYTAQTLTADEALAMGLVNRVVPRDALESTVEDIAARIARARRSTLMGTKALLVRAWEAMGIRQHLQMSADVMSIMEKTSDAVAVCERLRASGMKPRQLAED
jgi:enoyl-CoA hydratase/carnithine racemase